MLRNRHQRTASNGMSNDEARLANFVLLGALLLMMAGCASSPQHAEHLARPDWTFPGDARITERAILTARGKEYPLNGFLACSQTGGLRLVVTESFGQVLADVLVNPEGHVFVMRSSRILRPGWIRRYVARDLQCIFAHPPLADPSVTMPETNHFVIQRPWYSLDLRVVQVEPGPQPGNRFDPNRREAP